MVAQADGETWLVLFFSQWFLLKSLPVSVFNFPNITVLVCLLPNVSFCSDIRRSRPAQSDKRCVSYPELCGAEPDVGPCRAMFPHWYYDSSVGSCKGFTYGGCRGNKNNYVSEQSCMDTCTGEQHTCERHAFRCDACRCIIVTLCLPGVTVLPASQKTSVADDLEGKQSPTSEVPVCNESS